LLHVLCLLRLLLCLLLLFVCLATQVAVQLVLLVSVLLPVQPDGAGGQLAEARGTAALKTP
jgi:hypothetical protein